SAGTRSAPGSLVWASLHALALRESTNWTLSPFCSFAFTSWGVILDSAMAIALRGLAGRISRRRTNARRNFNTLMDSGAPLALQALSMAATFAFWLRRAPEPRFQA